MNKQKARPAPGKGAARDHGQGWDDRPAGKGKSSRAPYEDDFYGERPAREAKARPQKARGASLPFGGGYEEDRPLKPVKSSQSYGARPARKARPEDGRPARKARPLDEDYPVRAERGYDEELPVRRRSRAQSPRPVERYDRPYRDEFEAFDRPLRRAASKPGRRKKKKAGNAFLYWALAIVLALLIGFGVRTFFFEMIIVRGDAMQGTLVEGETALVQKSVYYGQKPARGDIVAVHSPDGVLIRRVVALPGETIEIRSGATYVNDEPLDEPYVSVKGESDYPLTTIPDGCYFVMGDNRLNADDSRTFGLIKNTRSLIVGKVQSIVWPPTGWGSIGR